MSKITHYWDRDSRGLNILVLQKPRGKFILDEILDYLLYEAKKYGIYAIVINAQESCCGVGWGDEEKPQGDTAILYEVSERENCPICGGTAPYQHCPECGKPY